MELYLLSQYAFMVWCLVTHRDNFTFVVIVVAVVMAGNIRGISHQSDPRYKNHGEPHTSPEDYFGTP
jgi:hypothetical protein